MGPLVGLASCFEPFRNFIQIDHLQVGNFIGHTLDFGKQLGLAKIDSSARVFQLVFCKKDTWPFPFGSLRFKGFREIPAKYLY